MSEIAIIGAGAWGTALSIALGRKGSHAIRLWAHEKEVCEMLLHRRVNPNFLPGCSIPETVRPTTSLEGAIFGAQVVVSVMPSHHCRSVFQEMQAHFTPDMLMVSATKGIENGTNLRMTEIIRLVVENANGFAPRVGALSGPSFALEVARGDPTAITIASDDDALAATVQQEFSDPNFRIYTNNDPVGVELAGALKNSIAIAAGISAGLGLGHNSIAALITRGLAEMTRLIVACGGKAETMAGLAGLGDLVLTCTGGLSRNRSVGVELGRGQKLPEILAEMHGIVAEGIFTTNAAIGLAREHGIEMPIIEQMHAILHEGKAPRDAIRELMTRSGKSEATGT
jgi:glycerol-3-phosphate dehydrogenase (NAD(P)+)